MFASGTSILFLLSMRCSVYISDCFCGKSVIVVAIHCASFAFGRMCTVESRSYVGFLCMCASLFYVLKNNPSS